MGSLTWPLTIEGALSDKDGMASLEVSSNQSTTLIISGIIDPERFFMFLSFHSPQSWLQQGSSQT